MITRTLIASFTAGLSLAVMPVNAEVMVGAFVPGNAWNQQAITDLNNKLPKSMAFVNVFSSYSASWDHLYWQSSKIVNEGMTPMISWMPIDYSRYNDNILPEIALGNWDAYIDLWGQKLVAWVNSYPQGSEPSVLLRFGHEFNGSWYPYGDSPYWYKTAWQHVHDRFEVAGANEHVEWVWSANNVNVDTYNDVTQYYPGDHYVDWTSIDGYNWGSNFTWSSWDSFTDVFSPMYTDLVTNYPDKPIIIGEVGSADPADTPDASWGQNGDDSDYLENKDVWTADMMQRIEDDFPAIRAVGLFNIDKELSWSLTEPSSTGLSGFTSGLQSSHFTSEFLTTNNQVMNFTLPATGQSLDSATQTFSWDLSRESWLYVGSSPGGQEYADSGVVGVTDYATISGLPTDGSSVYVRLWYREMAGIGLWEYRDAIFTAANTSASSLIPSTTSLTAVASSVELQGFSNSEVYIQEVASEPLDDLNWAYDMIAQVTVSPEALVIGAARKKSDPIAELKQEVADLTKDRNDIARLEKEIDKHEQSGSRKQLKTARSELAKARSRFNSRKSKLLKMQTQMREQQASQVQVFSRKKIKKGDQRLRAVSKPLPEVNISKRDRMRIGFRSMTREQRALFNASKRAVVTE